MRPCASSRTASYHTRTLRSRKPPRAGSRRRPGSSGAAGGSRCGCSRPRRSGAGCPTTASRMIGSSSGFGLADDRRVDAARQAPLQLRELASGRPASPTSMLRSSSNSTVMLAAPWREEEEISLTPSTEVHRVLDEVDDVRLHDLGGGALPGDRDVHDREVHVGVLADPEALEDGADAGEAEDAEPDEGEHQDPGEDVVPDRDVRQGHPGGDLRGDPPRAPRVACLRSWPLLLRRRRRRRRPPLAAFGSPRVDDLDRDPVRQPVGALGHHRLARLQARRGSPRCPLPVRRPMLDRPHAGLPPSTT